MSRCCWERTIRHPLPPERFVAELRGATDHARRAAGEDRALHLDDGRVLTVALRMTGALLVVPAGTAGGSPRARRLPARRWRVSSATATSRKFGRIGLCEGGGMRARRAGRDGADGSASRPRRTGSATSSLATGRSR